MQFYSPSCPKSGSATGDTVPLLGMEVLVLILVDWSKKGSVQSRSPVGSNRHGVGGGEHVENKQKTGQRGTRTPRSCATSPLVRHYPSR